jgi:hypothetical protein
MKIYSFRYFCCLLFCALSIFNVLPSYASIIEAQGSDPNLSSELQRMALEDQALRERQAQSHDDVSLEAAIKSMDQDHAIRISMILKQYGWPHKDKIGTRGLRALWTLIQHGDQGVLKESLPFMQDAAKTGELSLSLVALSIDRDLIYDGKKQRYGTQFHLKGNRLEMYPVEDDTQLDVLRKGVGLNSMAEYRVELATFYKGMEIN